MAVAPDGVISISFFDTRVDSAHRWIDVFLAQSIDRGASFLANVRVTTQAWNLAVDAPVDSGGSQFIDDYQGLAVDNQFAYPFWNDTPHGMRNEIENMPKKSLSSSMHKGFSMCISLPLPWDVGLKKQSVSYLWLTRVSDDR